MTLRYDFLSIRITLSGNIEVAIRQHTFNASGWTAPEYTSMMSA
jgi:hypothetical protein